MFVTMLPMTMSMLVMLVLISVAVVVIMFMVSFALTALGVVISSRMSSFEGFGTVSNFIVMPMYFLSGAIYPTSSAPDYPKLGQTKDFLLIGVNFYPSFSSTSSTQSDLLWAAKPQGTGIITTCPASPIHGKISNVLKDWIPTLKAFDSTGAPISAWNVSGTKSSAGDTRRTRVELLLRR